MFQNLIIHNVPTVKTMVRRRRDNLITIKINKRGIYQAITSSLQDGKKIKIILVLVALGAFAAAFLADHFITTALVAVAKTFFIEIIVISFLYTISNLIMQKMGSQRRVRESSAHNLRASSPKLAGLELTLAKVEHVIDAQLAASPKKGKTKKTPARAGGRVKLIIMDFDEEV